MVDDGPFLTAGLVLALLTALLLDDRKVVKRLGFTALIVGVLEVLLVGILLLGSLMAPPNIATGRGALDFGITHRMIAAVLFALVLVGLGLGARKALARWPERDPGGRRTSDRIAL